MCESCKSMINRGIKENIVMFFTKNSVFVQKKRETDFPSVNQDETVGEKYKYSCCNS